MEATQAILEERFSIHHLGASERESSFAEDVRVGLSKSPKSLPPKHFYDELGSLLFDAICLLPEYYVTRTEAEILRTSSGEIASAAGSPVRLAELGSGSSVKTRYLIEAILDRQARLEYLPVDISAAALEKSAGDLLHSYPGLSITAHAADFGSALEALGAERRNRPQGEKLLLLFLGSTIGNYEPAAALELLREIRGVLSPGDSFLLGTDLKKAEEILVPAYDDPLGVTAAFNLNVLKRINQELEGTFDLGRFAHRALYNREEGRIEMHLASRGEQSVAIRQLGLEVSFADGETIHTESSHKFDREQIAGLARGSGFALEHTWQDEAGYFSLNLLVAG